MSKSSEVSGLQRTLMPRMKGTGASSRSSILSWTGSTGSSRDCHAKGRMRGMSDSTDALSTPMLGQKTAICRSSSAAAPDTTAIYHLFKLSPEPRSGFPVMTC